MRKNLKIKPHHFIDIIMSFSEEKINLNPHAYGHAVHIITKKIVEDKNLLLQIELGADAICEPCIHNISGRCDDIIDTSFRPNAPSSKQEWNLQIDQNWSRKLKFSQGDKITVNEFCMLLINSSDDLGEIYLNVPREYILKKELNLKKGLNKFLEDKIMYES